jgi:aminopeptidase N
MSMPDIGTTTFLILSLGTAAGSLAYLAAQRAAGAVSKTVKDANEQARRIEVASRDLADLRDQATREGAGAEVDAEISRASQALTAAQTQLERAIDGTVAASR